MKKHVQTAQLAILRSSILSSAINRKYPPKIQHLCIVVVVNVWADTQRDIRLQRARLLVYLYDCCARARALHAVVPWCTPQRPFFLILIHARHNVNVNTNVSLEVRAFPSIFIEAAEVVAGWSSEKNGNHAHMSTFCFESVAFNFLLSTLPLHDFIEKVV